LTNGLTFIIFNLSMNAKNIIGLLIALLLILGVVWYIGESKEEDGKMMKKEDSSKMEKVESDSTSDSDSDQTNVTLEVKEDN
jgi:hypothetical protein